MSQRHWISLLLIIPLLLWAALAGFDLTAAQEAVQADQPASAGKQPAEGESRKRPAKGATIRLAELRVSDMEGQQIKLPAAAVKHGVAFVFLSTECPIARRYLPEVVRLQKEFAAAGLPIYGVISDRSVSRKQARTWQQEFNIAFPVIFDASGELASALGPTHTPEAFVYDEQGKLMYRGRIDNFFGDVGRSRRKATKREFFDALNHTINDRVPEVRYKKPVGCPIEENETPIKTGAVTYCRDVAPIIYHNCVGCHREGEVAPFPLTEYKDAAKRAGWLAEVTSRRLMPPWNVKAGYGHFRGERTLSQHEIAALAAWAKAGAPLGNRDDLPPLPKRSKGWPLGKPDLVVRMPKPVTIPADGPDVFRYVPIPIDLPEDHYVAAIDFRPGNPLVVHHAIIATVPQEFFKHMAPAAEMPGFDPVKDGLPRMLRMARLMQSRSVNASFGPLGAWVPGMRPYRFPEGVGAPLKKDSMLLLQMHYYPSGKKETDQSEVAIYFCKKPVERIAAGFGLNVLNLNIPPGEAEHRVRTSLTLPVDVTLMGIAPHMHLLGRQMKVTATRPDGKVENLIWVDDWDWNWQGQYRYVDPIRLPKGTRLDLEAVYDNSKDNPANPHSPPQRVRFGRKTTDEMCLCFLQVALDRPEDQRLLRQAAVRNVMKQFGGRFERLFGGGKK